MSRSERNPKQEVTGNGHDKAREREQKEVLTLLEAAELLRVSERTLWMQAKGGEVPHRRVGTQYRFLRSQLLDWMASENESGVQK